VTTWLGWLGPRACRSDDLGHARRSSSNSTSFRARPMGLKRLTALPSDPLSTVSWRYSGVARAIGVVNGVG
jgi:hypothetical protein